MFPDKDLFPNETGRPTGAAWKIQAPAKLNLYLEVLGPRADGFHALETLMVPVRVYDQLSLQGLNRSSSGEGLSLRVRNLLPNSNLAAELLGDDNDNLILRAARLLAKTAGVAPLGRFDLVKRIPIQAGMGGGSSDAAAALMLANAAWQINYPQEQLLPLATQLGSDVPFFLNRYFESPRAAICRGRGELIEPVNRLPKLHFVIAKPASGLSTAEVFGQLEPYSKTAEELAASSRTRLLELITSLQSGAIAAACDQMTNRLESAAARLAPWLVELRETFSEMGCLGHFMTGSGSAYVGVMRSSTQARRTARQLAARNLGNVFATSTC